MDTNLDGDGSSSDLDISNDINGCIKSLDDDIEGPPKSSGNKTAPGGDTQSSRSSSSSSSSSSSDSSSSSSSKSSKTSSSHKKSKEKPPDPKIVPVIVPAIVTDRVLYPARLYKKPVSGAEKSHKVQHRSRSRSRVPRPARESGYKTDCSEKSDKSMRRRKSRAPSAPRASAPIDIDLDLRGLQLSTEPSTSVKLTKRNVNLMARKNDTNNNNSVSNTSKVRPTALNLELNRRLLEHKMDLNGKTTSFASSCKIGFKGFKSSQSFQELTANTRVMAPSWTAEEKVSSKPAKYAKSLNIRTIKSRRSSVASRAGSVRSTASTISRMRRATTPAVVKNNEYVVAQVAEITAALAKCSISTTKNSKSSKICKVLQNTTSKKKKTVSKRKSKKNIDNDSAPAAEDHKLPLKKRHYLINDDKVPNGTTKRKRLKKSAPPGIFEPTEQHDDEPSFDVFNIMCPHVPESKPVSKSVVDNILTKMDPTGNKRKRRRANRTGFPTPKRPKKKLISDNASDTSSVVRKRTRKPKSVPEENLQSLSLRQLQLKQQKEIELKNNQESRTIRGRAKSVCHTQENDAPLPAVKRKRRQTIFVEHKTLEETLETLTEQPVVSTEKPVEKPAKKRRQTILIESQPSSSKKPKQEIKKPEPLKPDCPVKLVPKNVYNGDTQKRAFVASLKGTKCRCAPNPCGESCLNRSMFIECDVSTCGKSCTNAVIQTGGLLNKDVEKFKTEHKGFGVRTKKDIPKKTLILEYTGEVLFLEAFRQRMQTIYKSDQHHYCLELSGGLVLDGHRMGSLCRFVNHSCKPNCGMAKIYVDGLPRMILQAEDDIKAGTELTYDYKFDNFEDMTPQQCFCGAETCRGTLSAQMKAPRRASMSIKVNRFKLDVVLELIHFHFIFRMEML
jgi:SET domain/AWS domain